MRASHCLVWLCLIASVAASCRRSKLGTGGTGEGGSIGAGAAGNGGAAGLGGGAGGVGGSGGVGLVGGQGGSNATGPLDYLDYGEIQVDWLTNDNGGINTLPVLAADPRMLIMQLAGSDEARYVRIP